MRNNRTPIHLRRPAFPAGIAASILTLFLAGCAPGGAGQGNVEASIAGKAPPASPKAPAAAETVPAPASSGEAKSPPSLGEGSWMAAAKGAVTAYHPAPGILRARQTTKLGSQVNGRVREVLVDVGDRVKAGQDLLRLDPAFFEIEVSQRKADVESARVAKADAELNFGRMKNLWEKPDGKDPSVPRKLFDDAKARLETTGAAEKQALEALAHAEERRKESVIRAPYDGVVARRLVDAGEPVTSAPVTELLVVQEVDRLDLEFSLPQEFLSRVGPGTRVEYEVEGIDEGKGSGTIATIFPSLDEATRTFRCRLTIDNPGNKYRPGVLVKVRAIVAEVRDVLSVPSAALVRSGPAWEVTILAGGRPERRPVEAGVRASDRAEIRSGLAEGDQVWVPRTAG